MARRRESPTGRMLFTDFDASGKGRPGSTLADDETNAPERRYLAAHMPTIEELASSLDLDFEDDWGADASEPEPQREERPAAVRAGTADEEDDYIPDRIGPFSGDEKDEELAVSDITDNRLAAIPPPEAEVPFTWDEFADAFQQALTPDPGDGISNLSGFETEGLLRPSGRRRAVAVDDDESDILSAIAPPSDDDDDGSEDGVYQPFAGKWRGHRLGVDAPRAVPYGGIKRLEEWYRPPEEQSGDAPAGAAGEWYEPPENPWRAAVDAAFPAPAPETKRNLRPDTTGYDMFSGIDIDAMWEEKVRHARESQEASGPTDTRSLDMFDDIDLESLWEEKRRRAGAPRYDETDTSEASASDYPSPHQRGDGKTGVIDSSRPDQARTVILSGDPRLADIPPPPATAGQTPLPPRPRKSTRRKSPPLKSDPNFKVGDDTLGFLDDLDSFVQDGAREPEPRPQAKRTTARKSSRRSPSGLPSTIEELEIGDLVATAEEQEQDAEPLADDRDEPLDFLDTLDLDDMGPAVNDSVKAPVIGDGDIEPFQRAGDTEEENAGEAGDAAGAAVEDGDDFPAARSGGKVFGGDVSSAGNDDEEPLLSEPIGLDALLEREKANPPEIAREKPKPAAEEEPAEHKEPEAGEVAVDPMDVFANMDDMDFSDDGLDDEMKAMLGDDEDAAQDETAAEGGSADQAARAGAAPKGRLGKVMSFLGKYVYKVVPKSLAEKATRMIAWRENWWFYCDLFAALVSSASLAVILSYYIWYR